MLSPLARSAAIASWRRNLIPLRREFKTGRWSFRLHRFLASEKTADLPAFLDHQVGAAPDVWARQLRPS